MASDEERAAKCAALFNHYDASGDYDLWRRNIPIDAKVTLDAVRFGSKKRTRGEPGCWMVSDA